MKTFNTATNTNDIGMFAGLLGCAALSVALLTGFSPAAAPLATQTMEPIIITAKRVAPLQMATLTLAPIVITAPRLTNIQNHPQTATAQITLAPMVIVANRITV